MNIIRIVAISFVTLVSTGTIHCPPALAQEKEPGSGVRRQTSDDVVGQLDVIEEFYAPQLDNNRTIRVWLPPDYETNLNKRYPVIYFHDGQHVFEPDYEQGVSEWRVDETVTSLIKRNQIRPAIIVAMDCTDLRAEEYDFEQRGSDYAAFIIETLKPLIDRDYRTLRDRNNTFTIGSSFGGRISIALAWAHSEVFSGAGGLSTPPHASNNSLFKTLKRLPTPKFPVKFYFDRGDQGLDETYVGHTDKLYDVMIEAGLSKSNVIFKTFPGTDHVEHDWAKRVDVPIKLFLGQ